MMPSLETLDISDLEAKLTEKFQGGEWTAVPYLRPLTPHISQLLQFFFSQQDHYLAMLSTVRLRYCLYFSRCLSYFLLRLT